MVTETSDLQVIQDLIDAGVLTEGDVVETRASKDRDGQITADANGRLNGGDGDDTYVGQNGLAETFFFDGRHDNNDEGRHVNVVQNFSFDDGDRLNFRLDGGFFRDADGQKIDQTTNGNVATFTSARDIADLLLHVNLLDGVQEGLEGSGGGATIGAAELDAATNPNNGKVGGAFRRDLRNETTEGSFAKVVGDHIVVNFDDGNGGGETVDRFGNYQTNDVTLVFEDFAATLAAQFTEELGFAGAGNINQDSVHIASIDGGTISGGDGDNLFILGNGADTVSISRDNLNNDDPVSVNILHGFDLAEDSIFLSTNTAGQFTDGANNGRFKTFEGAAGILEIIANSGTVNVEETDAGDLVIQINLRGGTANASGTDPLTLVLTDTSLADVQAAAVDGVFQQLIDAGVILESDVAPSNQDGVIVADDAGRVSNNDGDDLLIGAPGATRFGFDSRDANNDEGAHVDAIIGFGEGDSLTFRIDGGYFADFDFRTINNNQASVGFDEIEALADFVNAQGGDNEAFFNAETNSTVFVIDDSPGLPGDELTIVLFDAGNLL